MVKCSVLVGCVACNTEMILEAGSLALPKYPIRSWRLITLAFRKQDANVYGVLCCEETIVYFIIGNRLLILPNLVHWGK